MHFSIIVVIKPHIFELVECCIDISIQERNYLFYNWTYECMELIKMYMIKQYFLFFMQNFIGSSIIV